MEKFYGCKQVAERYGVKIAGFGAAGTSTKQAYLESGQLSGKEFGYGALSGFTEGALEGVSSALSMGTGQIVNSVTKSFAKETTKTVAKQSVIKTLAKGFIGEAFEEGMSEILDPVWQRMTYDKNAENATLQEVAYAAFVGGMSGMIMSGGNAAIDSGNSFLKGNSLVGKGLDTEVMGLSQQLSEFEGVNHTGDETFQSIAQTYADLAQSLATTDGKVTTVTQKKLLGDLHRANTVAVFKPMIARSAANIVNNADLIAQRLNEYGYGAMEGERNRIVGAVLATNSAILEILTTVYANSKNLPQGVKDLVNLKYANCLKSLEDDKQLMTIVEAVRNNIGSATGDTETKTNTDSAEV